MSASSNLPIHSAGQAICPDHSYNALQSKFSFQDEAYVDSGAFCSIFQGEILERLQLKREQGRLKAFKAADGKIIPAYLFRLPLQIGDMKIRAVVAFSDKLSVGFNLLGRQSIFESFGEVTFNEREKKVVFRSLR